MRFKVITGNEDLFKVCPFSELTLANMQEYCSRHGYEFKSQMDGWGLGNEVTWGKVRMAREELENCDWLVWLDIDVLVLNMTIKLESLVDDEVDLVVTTPFEPCYGCKHPVYNPGIFLLRNSEWSHDFLDNWWKAMSFQATDQGKINIPLRDLRNSYLQDQLDRWWDTEGIDEGKPETAGCAWLGDMGFFSCRVCNNPNLRSHIKVVPREIAGWATITGKPEQFLTHQYGAEDSSKETVFKYLLQQVIR